ncbi:MAG: polysaccharide deacetylase family protein [Acidobacteria bacterium]|nr:polysaccharide deacetylase family protein [Acidobacteriota bacterium]
MHALPPRDGVVNAFTVDVEDYFQVSAFDAVVSRADWSRITPRVQIGLHRLLDLLDRRTVKGTFFILGWIAETHPSLVREIADAGTKWVATASSTTSCIP